MVSLNMAGWCKARERRSNFHVAMTVRLLVTSLTLALAVAGCSRDQPAEKSAASSSPPPAAPRAAATPEQAAPKESIATDPAFKELVGQMATPLQDFPRYERATLVGSAEQARPHPDALSQQPPEGHRVEWTTTDSVPAVMD